MLLRPYIHTSIHPYIHTCIHPYIYTCIHPYIHTSIHPYNYTCIPAGRYLLVSSLGRVEKTVEAHKGAVLGALWSHDGSALITCMFIDAHIKWISLKHTLIGCIQLHTLINFSDGEEGALKVWSRSGMLRTSLAQSGNHIHPYTDTPIHPYTHTPIHPYTHSHTRVRETSYNVL